MTAMKRSSFRLLTTVIIPLVLCGLTFVFIINSGWLAKMYRFESYQEKELSILDKKSKIWKNQNIDNYRLRLQVIAREHYYDPRETPTVSSTCAVSIDVQNKNTTSIFENTCGGSVPENFLSWETPNLIPDLNTPPSMDDLFVSIRNTFAKPWCGPNGCKCDGYYAYSIGYDSSFGYPQSLKVIYIEPPSTQLSRIFCTLAGTIITLPDYEISILQLP